MLPCQRWRYRERFTVFISLNPLPYCTNSTDLKFASSPGPLSQLHAEKLVSIHVTTVPSQHPGRDDMILHVHTCTCRCVHVHVQCKYVDIGRDRFPQ